MQPGAVGLARKRSGLVVAHSEEVGARVGQVAQVRRGDVEVVSVFRMLDHPKRVVVCKGGEFWMDAVVCRVTGGARAAGVAGLLAHCAHGLIVLFRQVVVTLPASAPGQTSQEHEQNHSGSREHRPKLLCLVPTTTGRLPFARLRYPHLSGAEGMETDVDIIMDGL